MDPTIPQYVSTPGEDENGNIVTKNPDDVHDASKNEYAHSTAIDPSLFVSAGVMPIGPVCLWPIERHAASLNGAENPDKWDTAEEVNGRVAAAEKAIAEGAPQAEKVRIGAGRMMQGLAKTAASAVVNGRVSKAVREQRLATCKGCPALIKASNRCSECGCFMTAKTWIAGDPKQLCPLKKWEN